MSTPSPEFRCGYVAIIGRPNVGKSTLLNYLIEQKISITSDRPQTTRHRILGIKTLPQAQILYLDTPGIHRGGKRALNRYMNRVASAVLHDVDVIVFVIEALRWTEEDQAILERLAEVEVPVILAVNKVDKLEDKAALLPFLQEVGGKRAYATVVPLSALKGVNAADLENELVKHLPIGAAHFPEDQITDRSERFLAAELVREKLMRNLVEELPYAVTVEIEKFAEEDHILHIAAVIWVEKEGQKAIVIGKEGRMLKKIGTQARREMEKMFDHKVFLQLWVKVKEGWSEDQRLIQRMGYTE